MNDRSSVCISDTFTYILVWISYNAFWFAIIVDMLSLISLISSDDDAGSGCVLDVTLFRNGDREITLDLDCTNNLVFEHKIFFGHIVFLGFLGYSSDCWRVTLLLNTIIKKNL